MSTYAGPATLFYLGRVELQASNVTYDIETGNKEVKTMPLGYAGHARGAKMVNLSVDFAIPSTGLQIDWVAIANAQGEIDLTLRYGNKQDTLRGNVPSANITSDAEGITKGSFKFMGKLLSTTTVQ
jgi:hypothetical protein